MIDYFLLIVQLNDGLILKLVLNLHSTLVFLYAHDQMHFAIQARDKDSLAKWPVTGYQNVDLMQEILFLVNDLPCANCSITHATHKQEFSPTDHSRENKVCL